jgi:hypothetical protein
LFGQLKIVIFDHAIQSYLKELRLFTSTLKRQFVEDVNVSQWNCVNLVWSDLAGNALVELSVENLERIFQFVELDQLMVEVTSIDFLKY